MPTELAGQGLNPAVLIELAVFCLGGLPTVLGLAFWLGKHSNRLKALEDHGREKDKELAKVRDELGSTRSQHAALDATMKALDRTVADGFRRLEGGIRDAIAEARSGRRSPRAMNDG